MRVGFTRALPLLALLLGVACGWGCLSGGEPAREPRPSSLPERGVAAHRGARATHPENTLAAFREAIRLGAHQIELDVRATADDRLVVIHDATLDRTTDGSGRVSERSLEEIKRLDAGSWKGEQFAGESVPTLAEALEIMPRDRWLNLHVKDEPWVAIAAAALIRAQGRADQAFLAVDEDGARAVRQTHPEVWICDMERQLTRGGYLRHAAQTGADFIQFHRLRGLPDADEVGRARRSGLRINYCCTDDPKRVRELFAAGVDFPLVDDLAAGLRAARALGIAPLAAP